MAAVGVPLDETVAMLRFGDGLLHITLDAGSDGLVVLDGSEALIKLGVVRDGQRLLSCVPHPLSEEVDKWIYDEIQEAPSDEESESEGHIDNLRLCLPHLPGWELVVQEAWLQIPCLDDVEDSTIPATLQMSGFKLEQLETRSRKKTRSGGWKRREREKVASHLFSIQEEELDQADTDCGSDCGASAGWVSTSGSLPDEADADCGRDGGASVGCVSTSGSLPDEADADCGRDGGASVYWGSTFSEAQ